jgi:ABC-type polysaccharide/polyol phosphate export permease
MQVSAENAIDGSRVRPRSNHTGERSVLNDLRVIVRDMWHYRDLLYQLTRRDIRIRYKQAIMGFGWAVMMPVLIVLAGLVVRLAMASFSHQPIAMSDLAGIALKAIPWAFFVGAIGFATPSLTANTTLVTKVYFAREVLPLSATLAQVFDSAIGGIALALVLPFMGAKLTLALAWVPVLLVLLIGITAAAALVLSCANLFFRDVKYIVQVLLTFGIFATPVFFEPAMFGPRGARLLMLNPLSPIMEGLRLAVIDGHNLATPLVVGAITAWSPAYLVYAAAWAIVGLFASSILFHRLEFVFAEYV